jgi:hypothetical protein
MKTKALLFFIFFSQVILINCIKAQINDSVYDLPKTFKAPKFKSNFYLSWGYTRCWYSKSTIHLKDLSGTYYPETQRTHYYDFKIVDAKAHDRPDFKQIKDVINITIPQFVFRIGYYFKKRPDMGFELNYDHAKYVVTDYQTAHIEGQIDGISINKDTILNPDNFIHFEHTDGANFWMFNFLKRWQLYKTKNDFFKVSYVVKPGAGFVYPRTDVTIFSTRVNNRWHIAGWIVGAESGLKFDFFKHYMFEFTAKGAFADYRKVLVLGAGGGSAKHHFFAGELIATIGYQF